MHVIEISELISCYFVENNFYKTKQFEREELISLSQIMFLFEERREKLRQEIIRKKEIERAKERTLAQKQKKNKL